MDLKAHIRQIPDFPKPGILFYDISTLLAHGEAWRETVDRVADAVRAYRPDVLAAIELRGFIFAAPVAYKLGVGFTMVRKVGKLPGAVVSHAYDLEYGSDTLQVAEGLVPAGQPRGADRRPAGHRRHRPGRGRADPQGGRRRRRVRCS